MFKLKPIGTRVKCYGHIVNSHTSHANHKRIGYRHIIKTTITIRHQGDDLPVYVEFEERKGRELYEWWIQNKRECAPVYIEGIKKKQKLGRTQKMAYEDAPRIIWVYIRANGKIIPLADGIPERYKKILIY